MSQLETNDDRESGLTGLTGLMNSVISAGRDIWRADDRMRSKRPRAICWPKVSSSFITEGKHQA